MVLIISGSAQQGLRTKKHVDRFQVHRQRSDVDIIQRVTIFAFSCLIKLVYHIELKQKAYQASVQKLAYCYVKHQLHAKGKCVQQQPHHKGNHEDTNVYCYVHTYGSLQLDNFKAAYVIR